MRQSILKPTINLGVILYFVKVGYFSDIDKVYDGKVLDSLSDTVKRFVHLHASWIPIVAETNDNNTVFF